MDLPPSRMHRATCGLVPSGNRYGDTQGNLGEDWPRALAHELGHYLLFLNENYIGFDDTESRQFVNSDDTCKGPMANPYRATQDAFYPAQPAGAEPNETEWKRNCGDTFSDQLTGRSDWETITAFYPQVAGIAPTGTYADALDNMKVQRLPWAFTQICDYTPLEPREINELEANGLSIFPDKCSIDADQDVRQRA